MTFKLLLSFNNILKANSPVLKWSKSLIKKRKDPVPAAEARTLPTPHPTLQTEPVLPSVRVIPHLALARSQEPPGPGTRSCHRRSHYSSMRSGGWVKTHGLTGCGLGSE